MCLVYSNKHAAQCFYSPLVANFLNLSIFFQNIENYFWLWRAWFWAQILEFSKIRKEFARSWPRYVTNLLGCLNFWKKIWKSVSMLLWPSTIHSTSENQKRCLHAYFEKNSRICQLKIQLVVGIIKITHIWSYHRIYCEFPNLVQTSKVSIKIIVGSEYDSYYPWPGWTSTYTGTFTFLSKGHYRL